MAGRVSHTNLANGITTSELSVQPVSGWSRIRLPLVNSVNLFSEYRKIPVTSPGLIQLRKGFWVGLISGGAYIREGL